MLACTPRRCGPLATRPAPHVVVARARDRADSHFPARPCPVLLRVRSPPRAPVSPSAASRANPQSHGVSPRVHAVCCARSACAGAPRWARRAARAAPPVRTRRRAVRAGGWRARRTAAECCGTRVCYARRRGCRGGRRAVGDRPAGDGHGVRRLLVEREERAGGGERRQWRGSGPGFRRCHRAGSGGKRGTQTRAVVAMRRRHPLKRSTQVDAVRVAGDLAAAVKAAGFECSPIL
jgi:hypothetical protein